MNVHENNAGDMQNLSANSSLNIPRRSIMRVNKNSCLCVNFFELFVTEYLFVFVEVTLYFVGAIQWTTFGKYSLIKINITLNISIVFMPE